MSETEEPNLQESLTSLRRALRAMARYKKKSRAGRFYPGAPGTTPDFYSTDLERYLKLVERGAIFSFSDQTHKLCWSVDAPAEAAA